MVSPVSSLTACAVVPRSNCQKRWAVSCQKCHSLSCQVLLDEVLSVLKSPGPGVTCWRSHCLSLSCQVLLDKIISPPWCDLLEMSCIALLDEVLSVLKHHRPGMTFGDVIYCLVRFCWMKFYQFWNTIALVWPAGDVIIIYCLVRFCWIKFYQFWNTIALVWPLEMSLSFIVLSGSVG